MSQFGGKRDYKDVIGNLCNSLKGLETHNAELRLLKEEALDYERRDLNKLKSGLNFSKYEEIELYLKQVSQGFKSIKEKGENINIRPKGLKNKLEEELFPNIRFSKRLQYKYKGTIKSFLEGLNKRSLFKVLIEKEELHKILSNLSAASFEIASYLMKKVSENKNIIRDPQPLNRRRYDFLETVEKNNQKFWKCGMVSEIMRKERETEWDEKLEDKF